MTVLLQVSDPHFGTERPAVMAALARFAQALRPDLLLVTGDITQVDLPGGTQSGLRVVGEILDGLEDVGFCRLTAHDVVRHKLVGKIVEAYDRYDARHQP